MLRNLSTLTLVFILCFQAQVSFAQRGMRVFKPAHYQYGKTSVVKSFEVDSRGGVFKVSDTGSPLDGVVISVPAGAVLAGRTIELSVGYDTGSLVHINSGTAGDFTMVLATKERAEAVFQVPINITVPFKNKNVDTVTPLPYFINNKGAISPAQLLSIDRTNKTFSFCTFHTGIYAWIDDDLRNN